MLLKSDFFRVIVISGFSTFPGKMSFLMMSDSQKCRMHTTVYFVMERFLREIFLNHASFKLVSLGNLK